MTATRAATADDVASCAAAARTAVASSHDVTLVVRGRTVSHGIGLVDDDGEPLLVTRQADLPHGPARVSVTGGRPGIGSVVLAGTLVPVSEAQRPDALALLRDHATCLGLGQGPRIRLLRLAVTSVAVVLPGTTGGPTYGLRPVALEAYARAHADPWVLFGEAMVRHLNHDHPGALGAVASGLSRDAVALGWVNAVHPDGLDLRVIDSDGAHDHRVPFAVRVDSPMAVPDQLRRLAPHQAGAPGDPGVPGHRDPCP